MNHSKIMDGIYSRDAFGYWSSLCEMFARACFLNDRHRESGERFDYLCGHSESCISLCSRPDGSMEIIKAMPIGKERTAINSAMRDMITDLSERGLFMTDEERAGMVRHSVRARLENSCMLEVSYSSNPAISEDCDACIGYDLYDSAGALVDGEEMDYNSGEFQSSDVAVIIPKAIEFCLSRKNMGYMFMAGEEKRSLLYMVMYGETRYFENTSSLDAAALCNAYADCRFPFVKMSQYEWDLGIEEYAVIEQGTSLSFSLKFDSEENEIVILTGWDVSGEVWDI